MLLSMALQNPALLELKFKNPDMKNKRTSQKSTSVANEIVHRNYIRDLFRIKTNERDEDGRIIKFIEIEKK